MIKAGPQIPSFTYAGVPDVELFDKVAEEKVATFTGDSAWTGGRPTMPPRRGSAPGS